MDISTLAPTVGSITVLAYMFGMAAKAVPFIKNEFIPVIVCIVGCALGIAGMNVIPDFPAQDWITAASVGAASGLASTGVNQMVKQLFTKSE